MIKLLLRSVLALAIATPAFATTYVVDDSGGPGVDFTTITAAIAAVAPGDVLLVKFGNYSAFTLSKGLTILGEGGPVVSGYSRIEDVPAGQVAVVMDIRLSRYFRVEDCLGTVILQRVPGCGFEVFRSRDVRFWSVNAAAPYTGWFIPASPVVGAALWSRSSRCEVVQSTMRGANTPTEEFPGSGSAGVAAGDFAPGDAGFLHLAQTPIDGGRGGNGEFTAGNGGPGLYINTGSEVVVAGGGLAYVRAGNGGAAISGDCSGFGGDAIKASAPEIRYSDVDLIPGTGCQGPGQEIVENVPGSVTSSGYADPTLGMSGSATAGAPVTFQVRAHPRSKVFLNYGRTPIVQPDDASQIDVLVDVIRGLKLGLVSPSGFVDRIFPIPGNAQVGDLIIFQAVVILPSGELRRTNSLPVVVR